VLVTDSTFELIHGGKGMCKLGKGERLAIQDRMILESADLLLQPEQPDRFDLEKLANISGVERNIILDRFPFPELLALGIVVMVWEEKTGISSNSKGNCVSRPNGFKLMASDWEPDPELLNHFVDHPVVRAFLLGEPPLRSWFKISGKVS